MANIYKKIFGKIQSGTGYKKGGYTHFDRDQSLEGALKRFRNFYHGGLAGKNLSAKDARKIADVVEPHLKNLPLGKKLSYTTKLRINERLWRMVLDGEISRQDFDDAKRIVGEF